MKCKIKPEVKPLDPVEFDVGSLGCGMNFRNKLFLLLQLREKENDQLFTIYGTLGKGKGFRYKP